VTVRKREIHSTIGIQFAIGSFIVSVVSSVSLDWGTPFPLPAFTMAALNARIRAGFLVGLLLLSAGANAAEILRNRVGNPFFVGTTDEGSTLVKLRTTSGEYSCEFKHATTGQDDMASAGLTGSGLIENHGQESFEVAHRDVQTVLAKLSGICIRKMIDYWKYEVCFESRITQTHGRDSFLLGTYAGLDENLQLYDEGTHCEAMPGNTGRMSRIEFVCDTALSLLSVEEVSTCSYKVYVSTPIVCGHPSFLQSVQSVPHAFSAKSNAGPPKSEWYLEIAELDGGEITCSVHALDPEVVLSFVEFELSLSTVSPGIELTAQIDLVRKLGRRSLSRDQKHYDLETLEDNNRITLKDGRSFNGELVLAIIQAIPG